MVIKLHFVLFPQKCPCNRSKLFWYRGTIYHMLEFQFSHHSTFPPSAHSTIHWSQLSFFSMTLKGLKNRCDVFIKRRLFLYAAIKQSCDSRVARCPKRPHSLTGYCHSDYQVERALMTPKNPSLTKMDIERLRKPDPLPAVCFHFRIFMTENPL